MRKASICVHAAAFLRYSGSPGAQGGSTDFRGFANLCGDRGYGPATMMVP